MTVPSAKDARLLGDQLHQDPVKYANNAAKLLACLQDPIQEVCRCGCCASGITAVVQLLCVCGQHA